MESLRSSFFPTLLVSLLLGLSSVAVAAEDETDDRIAKPYVEYRGGVSFVPNQNLTGADPTGSNLWGSARMQEGFNVGAAVGARFLEYFRGELAIDYRLNDVEDIGVVPGPTNGSGDLSLLTAMLNAYADYDLGVGVVPFVGLGIGYGHIRFDAESNQVNVSERDSVFAWNAMVGGTYPFSDVTDISLGYRYVATEDVRVESRVTGVGPRRLESEFDAHELFFALRFKF